MSSYRISCDLLKVKFKKLNCFWPSTNTWICKRLDGIFSVLIPYELKEIHLLPIGESVVKRNQRIAILKKVTISNEKSIIYSNIQCENNQTNKTKCSKLPQTTPKADIH